MKKSEKSVRKAIDNLNSLNGDLDRLCKEDDRERYGAGAGRSARVSMGYSISKVKKPMTLPNKDGGHLPLLKEQSASLKYASKRHERYPQVAADVKKVTSPNEAGYLNLRIKSSKAFPTSEVSAIEELIHKVRKMRDETRQSMDPQ